LLHDLGRRSWLDLRGTSRELRLFLSFDKFFAAVRLPTLAAWNSDSQ
jgi:hypothetical protein